MKPINDFDRNEIDESGQLIGEALDALDIPRADRVGQLAGRLAKRDDGEYVMWVANKPIHPIAEGVKLLFAVGAENPEDRVQRDEIAGRVSKLRASLHDAERKVSRRDGSLLFTEYEQLARVASSVIEQLKQYRKEAY